MSSLDFEAIRRDKFPLAPETIYDGLVQCLNHSKQRLSAENKRRQDRLNAGAAVVNSEVPVHAAGVPGDVFGCDPEAFAASGYTAGRRP